MQGPRVSSCRGPRPIKRGPDRREYGFKHAQRQSPCVGIVAGAMIAVEQSNSAALVMFCPMPERRVLGAPTERGKGRVVRDPAEAQDRLDLRHGLDPRRMKFATSADFRRRRLVFRGDAADGIGDHRILEPQAVAGIGGINTLGESEFQQGRVEQVARVIAGEGTTRPVGALQARRKADDQQARIRVAKGRDRRIEPVRAARSAIGSKRRKPRTAAAIAGRFNWPIFRDATHGRCFAPALAGVLKVLFLILIFEVVIIGFRRTRRTARAARSTNDILQFRKIDETISLTP